MVFTKLKLGTKLLLGFGMMIVLIGIVTLIGTNRMALLNDKVNGIAHVRMPQVGMLYDIMRDYDVIARATRNIALTKDDGISKKQKENFYKGKTSIMDIFDKLDKTLHNEKGKELFTGLKSNLILVIQLSEKALLLGEHDKDTEAADVIINEILAPQGKMLQLLQSFADYEQELALKDSEASAEAASGSKVLLLSLGVAASILGLFMAFLITRSITRPINRVVQGLTEGTDQVASASGQVASSSQQLAEGASEQAASIEETSSSLEEMSSMTKQNADNANQANQLMSTTKETVARASRKSRIESG